ncbi:histidinol-phosphate transaminase [Demequina capsici]|uniref:Aromatic amino acid aminotransferase n=1 Tax=Demequina capsici TaxID=3075620 RepID=A0AA96F984_9MICO|nr:MULTISPECIES: histidinol-phosphate transaminase [unclassified Demequina]WNM24371.1 histidinol-phosphate transaminase [Demequina sp. OYTSA14]WNM27193.1 histidinol-phosphate transaminase [Demequina sp. PMTSA13]
MTTPAPRPVIASLPRYVPGARGAADGPEPIKLSSNEMPYGPLPSIVSVVEQASGEMHRYPDMMASDVTEAIAKHCGVRPAQVVTGGGSVAVLSHILQAYTGLGDEVMFAWRSFEAYPILTQLVGASPVTVPLDSESRHDLPAMASAVNERTKLIMLCSPNNPTGPTIHLDEFEEFMAAVPQTVLVVLDEAYGEFVRDADTVDGIEALTRHPNLVLLRTFSKAYGLAGLRLGYAVASDEIAANVRTCVTPFSVSGVAQAAGIASLDAKEELLERVEIIVAERHRVADALREQGWTVPDAQGNFVWLGVREGTEALAAAMAGAARPVLVRPFVGHGVRITIGSPEENDALIAALADYPDKA